MKVITVKNGFEACIAARFWTGAEWLVYRSGPATWSDDAVVEHEFPDSWGRARWEAAKDHLPFVTVYDWCRDYAEDALSIRLHEKFRHVKWAEFAKAAGLDSLR